MAFAEIEAFAGGLMETARTISEIAAEQTVVIGEARKDGRYERWNLQIDEVLKTPGEEPVVAGSVMRLEAFGWRHAQSGSRVCGVTPSRVSRAGSSSSLVSGRRLVAQNQRKPDLCRDDDGDSGSDGTWEPAREVRGRALRRASSPDSWQDARRRPPWVL